jgi:hypothetical protein
MLFTAVRILCILISGSSTGPDLLDLYPVLPGRRWRMSMVMFTPLIKAAMLLTVSFFVLFTASKTKDENLQQFGRITAIVLWAIAGSLVLLSVYSAYVGNKSPKAGCYSKAKQCMMFKR